MRQWSHGGRGLVTGVFTTLVQKTCLRFHTQTSKARMNFSCFGTDASSHTTPGQSLLSSMKLSIRQCSKCSKLHITSNFLICICEEKLKPYNHAIFLEEVGYRTPERECSFLIFVK